MKRADLVADWRSDQITEHRTTLDELEEAMRGTYLTGGLGVSIDDVNTTSARPGSPVSRWTAARVVDQCLREFAETPVRVRSLASCTAWCRL